MVGRRSLGRRSRRFAAAGASLAVSFPAVGFAQGAPYAQQPYAQPGQYAPPPYGQPAPYGTQPIPGYTPLGGSSNDITADHAQSWIIARASGGVGLTFLPRTPVRPSAIVDATIGYRWAFAQRASLNFEGGYSFDSEPKTGGMFGALGLGPELYASRNMSFQYSPKLVLGATWQGFAIGVRNTLVASMLMHMLNVEVGYQYLRSANQDLHELRAQLGFDIGGLVYFVMYKALVR